MTWLLNMAKGTLWPRLAAVGALALSVCLVLFKARQSGKESERAKTIRQELKRAHKAVEVKNEQLKAAANRPDDDELDRVLRDGDF